MLDRQTFRKLSTWANVMGLFNIITGVIGIISLVGIIPGIINIVLGLKLTATKRSIDGLLTLPEGEDTSIQLNSMADNLGNYFMINAILVIVGLVLSILGVIIAVAILIAAGEAMGSY